MKKPIAAFDFATSGNFCDICAACIATGATGDLEKWPKNLMSNGMYPKKLSLVDLVEIACRLIELQETHIIVGWGSLGYDFRLLYKEGVLKDEIVTLALRHYDIMFQLFSETGDMVGLSSVQKIDPKVDSTLSKKAPELWHKSLEGQEQVMRHTFDQTVRTYNIAYNKWQNNLPIYWLDYKGSGEEFNHKYNLTPCADYIKPALSLPPSTLNGAWGKTFSWVRDHITQKTKVLIKKNGEAEVIYNPIEAVDYADTIPF